MNEKKMTNEQAITVLNMIEAHGSLAIQAKEKAVQALQTQPKWTPVSERLPDEQGIYLAYIINEYDNKLQYPMTAYFSPNKIGCSPQWFPDDETASDNVVAWMPLPCPYEGVSE